MHQVLKCGCICFRGYGVMGVLRSGLWLPPTFQRPLAAKLCVRPRKVFEMQERARVLYHRAKFGWARISPAAGAVWSVISSINTLFMLLSLLSNPDQI